MKIENKGFFSWQGNQLWWPSYSKWIAYFVIFLLLTIVFVFRNYFRNKFNNRGSRLLIKNQELTFQIFGFIGLAYILTKLILYIYQDYPLKWEFFQLHLCRIHFLIIMFLLASKKLNAIKYIAYGSIAGALFAIYFGDQTKENILPGTIKASLMENYYYRVGPDNFFYYDFYFFHIFLVVFPIYIWVSTRTQLTTKQFYKVQIFYMFFILIMWSFDWMSSLFPDEWKANNWYIGPNESNDYSQALGWLSGWPQNLISYILIGISIFWISHIAMITMQKKRKKLFNDFYIQHKMFLQVLIKK